MPTHSIVTKSEWLEARRALLAKEKELTRTRDRLAAERRALPWIKIEKPYVFDGPSGKVTLSDLFEGRSQLIIKHFMKGPGATTLCVGCSFEVDHIEGIRVHLNNHDVTYAAVARAPIEEIEALRRRMGWKFPFVSSYGSDFNYDFDVSFRRDDVAAGRALYNFGRAHDWTADIEDLSGRSVFFKDDDSAIYLTYASFARGGEDGLAAYAILDMTPNGRQENGPYHSLGDWVRPHDQYGKGGMVEPNGRHHAAGCDCAVHDRA
jgi:predicted dithiol-disulfide oxidoreductase (DUF899 family)